ncbi:hypothetical protein [Solibacillus sp. CAU 1738]|uniref:UPF0738 family protein n=1 Tax=Solibacillus sp. CAU 1738 TaxID=3140363 RepID=UPI0032610F9D
MRNIYTIHHTEELHNDIYFSLNNSGLAVQFQPVGQVIADSDNEAFIYIVEEAGVYSYLSFPKKVWPALVQVVQNGRNPFLYPNIELTNFFEELESLLWNIQGNDNYGSAFVQAVEESFGVIFNA